MEKKKVIYHGGFHITVFCALVIFIWSLYTNMLEKYSNRRLINKVGLSDGEEHRSWHVNLFSEIPH